MKIFFKNILDINIFNILKEIQDIWNKKFYHVKDREMGTIYGAIWTYNKNARFKVQVEWGIDKLKRKCTKCFMKRFNSTKPIFTHLLEVVILFIIFLHWICLDFTYKVIR
jgi:predicted double-glycine peptidase